MESDPPLSTRDIAARYTRRGFKVSRKAIQHILANRSHHDSDWDPKSPEVQERRRLLKRDGPARQGAWSVPPFPVPLEEGTVDEFRELLGGYYLRQTGRPPYGKRGQVGAATWWADWLLESPRVWRDRLHPDRPRPLWRWHWALLRLILRAEALEHEVAALRKAVGRKVEGSSRSASFSRFAD